MGDRYDVELAFNLREDVPPHVVSAIEFLIGNTKEAGEVPDHPYFDD